LREPDSAFHRLALSIALAVGGPAALLQPLSGDLIAKSVAVHQPAKLASMEALFTTKAGADFVLGGLPDPATRTVRYGLVIPNGLSLLLYRDANAQVIGLDHFPPEDWPPVAVVHVAFQIMVGCGLVMAAIATWTGWRWWNSGRLTLDRHEPQRPRSNQGPEPGAIEAGWVVTEVGRQPWIIDHVMRTADAVTPMPGLWIPMVIFTLLYVVLAGVVLWAIWKHIAATYVSPT
jgi:cytochrome d ubiquinol oxidase subunit I